MTVCFNIAIEVRESYFPSRLPECPKPNRLMTPASIHVQQLSYSFFSAVLRSNYQAYNRL